MRTAFLRPWLLACGVAATLLLSNSAFSFIDDEIAMITFAAQPVRQITSEFASGAAPHEHPPAYDVLLHFWIRLSGGRMEWLRVPAVAFYAVGLWLLSLVGARWGGDSSQRAVLVIGFLWPFGFHFGRIAGWYSFSFLCVAFLTWAYVRFREDERPARLATLAAAATLLLYTNYYGWAIVACLALHDLIEHRSDLRGRAVRIGAALALLVLLFAPVVPALAARLADGVGTAYTNYTTTATVLYGGFNLYSLFVSESVAPWFPWVSVPVLAAIVVVIVIMLRYAETRSRLLFFYFLLLFAGMSVLGIVGTKRLLLIAAWPLLAVALTVATLRGSSRRALAGALAVIAVAGWFGIITREYYSAPRFVEPWSDVAATAASHLQQGAVVVGSNPAFFFYLTYAARPLSGEWVFPGSLTVHSSHPRVFDAASWIEQPDPPLGATTLFVRGAHDPRVYAAAERAQRHLDARCSLVTLQRHVRDSGYELKQRYFPEAGRPEYRVEIREYSCPHRARPSGEV